MPTKLPKNKKNLVLLDSHAILHRAYHALPDFSSPKGEPTGALYGLSAMLIKIIAELKPDYLIAAYDLPGPTYRHEVYEDYKAGRPKLESELKSQIDRSRDVFNALGIPIYDYPGFEADDILGTIVEQTKKEKNFSVTIASGDMDTLQLVDNDRVCVFTLRKGISDTVLHNEKRVKERFGFLPDKLPDYKGLRGDPSDNIIGVKGVGEKTATTLISKFGTIENLYKVLKKNPEEFEKIGLSERMINILKDNREEAEFSKMLATIRRDAPIKFVFPKEEWVKSFDMQSVDNLFADLGFRTLGARLKETLRKLKGDPIEEKPSQNTLNINTSTKVSEKEMEEVALALWVVDSNFTNPTERDILNFARVKSFAEAKKIIFDEIKKRNLEFVYEEIEKPLIPVVKAMEDKGVKIEKKYLSKLSRDYHKELKLRESKIWKEAGAEFNINSPKQLGEVLFEKLSLATKNQKKTSTGMKSTRESELEKLRDSHPIIPLILEYREFSKLLSTYIDNIPKKLDSNDRLHTNLKQTGTTTGRMASTDPNLQNIPIKSELGRNIRKAFIAEKGFSLLSFDYSQIELRIAAILSHDEKLLDIFRKGEDVHTSVASVVFCVPLEKVDKEMRRKAKVINFGIIYGMGVNALRQNLGGSRDEAQKFYTEYFTKFNGLAKYIDSVKAEAEKQGFTQTLLGRRRYFEGIKSRIPYIKAAAERMAINAPFQGSAADIIKLAMKAVYVAIKEEKMEDKLAMILQVHDELLFEVRDEYVKEIVPKIRKIMESALPEDKSMGVVCAVHAAVGKNWNDMKVLDKN